MDAHPGQVGRLVRRNHYKENKKDTVLIDYTERLFKKDDYCYESPIHEQLVRKDGKGYRFYPLPITAEHYGYQLSPEETLTKTKRNNELLFQELKKEPDNPYLLFQIGQSFNMLEDYESAYEYYHRAALTDTINFAYEYVQHMMIDYGYSMLYTNRLEQALETFSIVYEAFDDLADFHCLVGNAYMRAKQYLKAMAEFIKASGCERFFVEGATTDIPAYNMGYINELLGSKEDAIMHYKRCRNFPMAEERLRGLLDNA